MSENTQKTKKIHKIVVDRKACIGVATCVVIAPDAFDLDESGIAIVKEGAENLDDNKLLMAAQSCPVLAIHLYDKEGNKIFPYAQ
ncbi:ferredoxin [bacterium]|nr:ferredoxin [bacterium]